MNFLRKTDRITIRMSVNEIHTYHIVSSYNKTWCYSKLDLQRPALNTDVSIEFYWILHT